MMCLPIEYARNTTSSARHALHCTGGQELQRSACAHGLNVEGAPFLPFCALPKLAARIISWQHERLEPYHLPAQAVLVQ